METEPTVETELTTFTGQADSQSDSAPLIEDELLVEEISIDGMCGVY
ncbi:MAG: mycofactocin precursor MftA [Acidimicrobiales bacterium]